MSRQTVNEDFELKVPDAFQLMSREELEKNFQDGNSNRWGMQNPESQVMITILWKKYPALLAGIASLKTMVKRNQQLISRGYAGRGYRLNEYYSLQAGDTQAEGYRFTFRQGDAVRAVDTCLLKHGKVVYSAACLGPEENKKADQAMFRKILSSLKFL